MPSDKEKLVYVGSGECSAIRVIHSNPLQEAETYRAARRAPDSGLPIKITVEKQGATVQPGDRITIKYRVTGYQRLVVEADNEDNNSTGSMGNAYLVDDPTGNYEWRFDACFWPLETRFADNLTENNIRELQYREQATEYRPGLTDEQIKETPRYTGEYNDWLYKRNQYWTWQDLEPPPIEEYERQNAINRIISELRDLYSIQWNPWSGIVSAYLYEYSGSYWTGARDADDYPIYKNYYLNWVPQLELIGLFNDADEEIEGEGISPHVLRAYEFVDEGGNYDDLNDWDNILTVNFMGTPEPLTVECDEDNCPGHCLEITLGETREEGWGCICHEDDLLGLLGEPQDKIKPASSKPPPAKPPIADKKKAAAKKLPQIKEKRAQKIAQFKAEGNRAETAHNQAKQKRAEAQDQTLEQTARDALTREAQRLEAERDEAIDAANSAAGEADALGADEAELQEWFEAFMADAEEEQGGAVGDEPVQAGGWKSPTVTGGGDWQSPTVVGGDGWRSPTVIGGGAKPPAAGVTVTALDDPGLVGGSSGPSIMAGVGGGQTTTAYNDPSLSGVGPAMLDPQSLKGGKTVNLYDDPSLPDRTDGVGVIKKSQLKAERDEDLDIYDITEED